jgi:FlaA1/EpsC-like NDP-sugar epimerase
LRRSTAPRWLIFLIDIVICLFALTIAYLLRFNFNIPKVEIDLFPRVFTGVILIRIISFYIAKTYAGIIRYTSTKDAERIFLVISIGSLFFAFLNIPWYYLYEKKFFIPYSIIIIDYITTVFLMIVFRVGVKVLYFEFKKPKSETLNILIYGAGHEGVIVKNSLERTANNIIKVVGFIDNNKSMSGKKIEGIAIYTSDQLEDIIEKEKVDQLIFAVTKLPSSTKSKIVETCLNLDVKVLNIPPVEKWINGELSYNQIRTIKIDDLIGREAITLDNKNISIKHAGKVILVTGAAGSIGSELVRQIIHYNPKKIILLDQSETGLYELEFELIRMHKNNVFEVVIGDIRNEQRMDNLFNTFKPELVYHAAAYKHVPLMEVNPSEAVRTNVLGSKILADTAIKHNVKQFVFISTDKAVNPTNVMGASKRIAEIYIQSLNQQAKTSFITTRFGNVLGSNGSVIQLFKKQIENGGPLTVTHPDVTRFFMTIPEACQLVLEACAKGKGGEIFIFDMGNSVKIIDLAKKMIRLSGLTLGKDIQIEYTGLRPGEKLYEELLADKENTLPTHHEQIMIAKVRTYEFEEISKSIHDLIELYPTQNNVEIVKKMKVIVPEYISNNSEFEQLDSN